LLRLVHGANAEQALFERRRLHLERPSAFRLSTPNLPAPAHLAVALLRARGLSWRDRLTTVAFVWRLRRERFRCPPGRTVAKLLEGQPVAAIRSLWEPLCVAALNTPIASASAQIFLNLLRAAFATHAHASHVLWPRVDLSALYPDAAARYVRERGGEIHAAVMVQRVGWVDDRIVVETAKRVQTYAAAVVAVGPHQLARLFDAAPMPPGVAEALARVAAFAYEPICTAYLRYPHPLGLPQPMMQLEGGPGQWIFDRGQLGGPEALAAVVISTDAPGARGDQRILAGKIDEQIRRMRPHLGRPAWTRVITERRATYACVAGLARPASGALGGHLYLAGDYTDQEFPATLEAATRSGVAAARALLAAA
jgi:squalene-associated FAD-dependent desaturase